MMSLSQTLLISAALVCTGSRLLAQAPAPPAPSPLSLQEQSIETQMSAITSTGAQQQAESIRLQADSLRRQHGSTGDAWSGVPDIAPVSASPLKADEKLTSSKPIEEAKDAAQGTTRTAAGADAPPVGFYTVPWPASPDFVMPNVQVATTACDALGGPEVNSLIKEASAKNKVDSSLLKAVMVQESGFRPCAISTAGAMGLMQIMPGTADELGLEDPFDPAANVDAGAKYLKQMLDRYHGDTALALAAYNAGPGRTDKANGTVPQIPETIGYVASILSNIPLF
jgi:soluble lytic murein transglycosylase-like protein